MQKNMTKKKSSVALTVARLDAISPLKTLERGYAIIQNENKTQVLHSIDQMNIGDTIHTSLKDGNVTSEIIKINSEPMSTK